MTIENTLKTLNETIGDIARAHGRAQNDINLIAVSKKQSDEKIQAALDAGHRLFGENRVQEAQEHWGNFATGHRAQYPDLKLHLIGPLQTNKVKDAIALFDVIETLDREKLAEALSKEMKKQNRHLPCFIQVNTGEEDQKSGIAPRDLENFYHYATRDCGLDIQGLMCIPPVDEPPALHFALLQKYANKLGIKHLSMGMSSDFAAAIPLGATYIRIGSGIFGDRVY